MSELQQLRKKFWTGFRDYLIQTSSQVRYPTPSQKRYLHISTLGPNFRLQALVGSRSDKEISVCLYIPRGSFSLLFAQQKEIEEEFGEPLEWEKWPGPTGNRQNSWIALHKRNTDPTDEADWPNQHAWLAEKLELFDRVFRQRIRDLDTQEEFMATLRPNRIKQKLADGELAYVVSGLTNADDIDAFGPLGFDGVWLEGEHGRVGPAQLGDLTRACDLWGMTPLVRVNRNDQGLIYRTLDCGAMGIAMPHVNTKAEAQNVVDGAKFAPIGHRGMYTSRQGYGVDNYFAEANSQTLLVVLVEDIAAVNNLDEILTVEHIDVFFVAPSDLATSMGHIGNYEHPDVQRTLDETLARIQAAGRVAGTLTTNATVEKYVQAGVRFLMTGVSNWIASGAAAYKHAAENAKL